MKVSQRLLNFFLSHNLPLTGSILGTLLMEPGQAIKSACLWPASWKRDFNFHGMNPKALTKEQAGKRPLLLMHANAHNQSGWMSLGKRLLASDLGPVYTVNLPNGDITHVDDGIIERKIEQIKQQFLDCGVQNIKIDLIGHSRGGEVAYRTACKHPEDIGKVIMMGYVLKLSEFKKIEKADPDLLSQIYEISATHDIFEPGPTLLRQENQRVVESGHVGLLFSTETHDCIILWLNR